VSKAVKELLPKKKRKGPTGDTISFISLSDTSSTKSSEPSIIEESTTCAEEGADAELGMLPLHSYNKKSSSQCPKRLKKDWNAPIYSFFHPVPAVDYDNGHHFHEFACTAKGCQKKICCYLDKADAKSTSNS
jgi:hypothetical protein